MNYNSNENRKSENKYHDYAQKFLKEHLEDFGFYKGQSFQYAGNHWAAVDMNECLRLWLAATYDIVSNNVIGNISPYIKDRAKVVCEKMPSWIDESRKSTATDPKHIIAFSNGLWDMKENKLYPHSRGWFSSCVLPYNYDPEASCHHWLKFLGEVFENDPQRIALLQEYAGYCMTPDTSMQKFLVAVHGK